MLKIYLRKAKYEIHNENKIVELTSYSDYAIRDEGTIAAKSVELGAYTEEAHNRYIWTSRLEQKKKGKYAYFYGWPREVYLREWDAPNAKLVIHITYREDYCSMNELMELSAPDVIAYLKQEGIGLVIPS